jgi:hypothetical protein
VQPRGTRAAVTEDTPLPFELPTVHRNKIIVDFNGGNQSSHAGLLLLLDAERKLSACERLAVAMPNRRESGIRCARRCPTSFPDGGPFRTIACALAPSS